MNLRPLILIERLLADSVRVVLGRCNGFDLDEGGSVLKNVLDARDCRLDAGNAPSWSDGERWGNFVGIARSAESESAYAIRPTSKQKPESPLFEIWPDGWDQWRKNKPLAQSFDAWLREIGDAIATGDYEQVYAKLWLDPLQDIQALTYMVLSYRKWCSVDAFEYLSTITAV